MWLTGTYDPELNLVFVGTGNPTPVLAAQMRPGDDPWTCSIVALNPDTGKLVWGFQSSPHDTHDWDAVRSEEHTSELQSQSNLVCRLLLEKKKKIRIKLGSD